MLISASATVAVGYAVLVYTGIVGSKPVTTKRIIAGDSKLNEFVVKVSKPWQLLEISRFYLTIIMATYVRRR